MYFKGFVLTSTLRRNVSTFVRRSANGNKTIFSNLWLVERSVGRILICTGLLLYYSKFVHKVYVLGSRWWSWECPTKTFLMSFLKFLKKIKSVAVTIYYLKTSKFELCQKLFGHYWWWYCCWFWNSYCYILLWILMV